ncbi:MAG: HNH endonuclease [Sphingopyxis terrae]|nr:MAG: HNH endonuclease [Sphingopyxis terrae]
MSRKSLTEGQRIDVLHAHGGRCYLCGEIINLARGDRFEVEHPVPLALGGGDTAREWRPAHVACHLEKTREDHRRIAKAKRVAAKHAGTFPKPKHRLPGHKGHWLKRKVGGTVVRRDEDERRDA